MLNERIGYRSGHIFLPLLHKIALLLITTKLNIELSILDRNHFVLIKLISNLWNSWLLLLLLITHRQLQPFTVIRCRILIWRFIFGFLTRFITEHNLLFTITYTVLCLLIFIWKLKVIIMALNIKRRLLRSLIPKFHDICLLILWYLNKTDIKWPLSLYVLH